MSGCEDDCSTKRTFRVRMIYAGPMADQTTPRPMRKDAELNRQRLLDAASELFAQRGLKVTLHDIARRAGVGVGTAYRHFDNKQQVIDAVFDQRLDTVATLLREALDDPDPWNGFTTYVEKILDVQQRDRGLTEIINNPELGQERISAAQETITPLLEALVQRAKQQGTLRPEFDVSDLVLLQYALDALIERTGDIEPTLWRRYLTMFMEGVRTDHGPLDQLPVGPLDSPRTEAAMTPARRGRSPRATAAP